MVYEEFSHRQTEAMVDSILAAFGDSPQNCGVASVTIRTLGQFGFISEVESVTAGHQKATLIHSDGCLGAPRVSEEIPSVVQE